MRSLLLSLPLLLTPATHAFADTFDYRFDGVNSELCGVYGGTACAIQTLEFTLTGLPTSYTANTIEYDPPSFMLVQDTANLDSPTNVILSQSGIDFPDLDMGQDFDIYASLFTGPTSNPTLLTTSVYTSGYLQFTSFELDGTLTVTDLTTVPTPEPTSGLLLATGLLGFGVLVAKQRT